MPNGDILAQHESAGPELSPINPAENGTLIPVVVHAIGATINVVDSGRISKLKFLITKILNWPGAGRRQPPPPPTAAMTDLTESQPA